MKKFLKNLPICLAIISFIIAIGYLLGPTILDRLEHEKQVRQERACKYHGHAINEYYGTEECKQSQIGEEHA